MPKYRIPEPRGIRGGEFPRRMIHNTRVKPGGVGIVSYWQHQDKPPGERGDHFTIITHRLPDFLPPPPRPPTTQTRPRDADASRMPTAVPRTADIAVAAVVHHSDGRRTIMMHSETPTAHLTLKFGDQEVLLKRGQAMDFSAGDGESYRHGIERFTDPDGVFHMFEEVGEGGRTRNHTTEHPPISFNYASSSPPNVEGLKAQLDRLKAQHAELDRQRREGH